MHQSIRDQQGQGVLEYIILTSLIGIFCLFAVKQLGGVIKTRIQDMREQIVDQIPTK